MLTTKDKVAIVVSGVGLAGSIASILRHYIKAKYYQGKDDGIQEFKQALKAEMISRKNNKRNKQEIEHIKMDNELVS